MDVYLPHLLHFSYIIVLVLLDLQFEGKKQRISRFGKYMVYACLECLVHINGSEEYCSEEACFILCLTLHFLKFS